MIRISGLIGKACGICWKLKSCRCSDEVGKYQRGETENQEKPAHVRDRASKSIFSWFSLMGAFALDKGVLYTGPLSRQARIVLILLIAIGCGLGGVCRYLGMTLVARYAGEAFPWGTLLVNLLGSFLLGAILGAGIIPEQGAPHLERLHALAAIGFCGGLTTFSTFSLQNLSLLSRQAKGKLAANILLNMIGCLLCVAGGFALLERWAV